MSNIFDIPTSPTGGGLVFLLHPVVGVRQVCLRRVTFFAPPKKVTKKMRLKRNCVSLKDLFLLSSLLCQLGATLLPPRPAESGALPTYIGFALWYLR